MTMSRKPNNNGSIFRAWLRRTHRWLGLAALLFVLLLSVTGIALNHSTDWGLDRRYVNWEWAARALGMRAPEPAASFSDAGHRVTQLGSRIYFDDRELNVETSELRGLVIIDPLAVVATDASIVLVTANAEIVEHIDLADQLPGVIARIGRADQRVVIESAGRQLVSDADITGFTEFPQARFTDIAWSIDSAPPPALVATLKGMYRGRAVTVERLLIEIHSGRILAAAGPAVLDIVGVVLILLSLSGLVVWLSHRGRRNPQRRPADTQ